MNNQPFLPANWVWTPQLYNKDVPQIVLFRREVLIDVKPSVCKVRLSADSRYRFFVNGKSVCQGPAKGDGEVWYYDEADLAPFLVSGKNILSAIVLRYPINHGNGNFSIWRTEYPGFYMDGDLSSGEGFFCHVADHITISKSNPFFEPLCIQENVKGNQKLHGWQLPDFEMDTTSDDGWKPVVSQMMMNGFNSPGNLLPRPIPFMFEKEHRFTQVMKVREGSLPLTTWESFIKNPEESITLPANSRYIVEIHAGELTTGFLELTLAKGSDSRISILCSESYAKPDPEKMEALLSHPQIKDAPDEIKEGILQMVSPFEKGDRLDCEHGELFGTSDIYTAGGFGSFEKPEYYEPFWFRTFRFLKLTITTGEEPLTLLDLKYRETGYPLEVKTKVETSDASLAAIWDISERTLRRCMHETYEDCPFYEQLQYVMDSRFQILATYMTSADDRLARKAIEDFARSQRYDGLIEGAYPSFGSNAIVNFSIFYILMVWDHWRFFGDRDFTIRFLPAMERIVSFYKARLRSYGVVERTSEGGQNGRYWSFIDWVPAWQSGVPTAITHGDVSLESLLYLLGLETLAEIEEDFAQDGWGSLAELHQKEAEALKTAIRSCFMDEEGLITDGLAHDLTDEEGHLHEAFAERSQHGQVLGVLTGLFTPEEAKAAMEKALNDSSFHQCTVSWGYYLFRALEKSGLYDKTENLWELWRDMVRAHLTTCVENNGIKGRSDCHAWGALALYELPAVILGVQPAAPGFSKIRINPNPGYLSEAEGDVITPRGMVHVSWEIEETGALKLFVQAQEGVEIITE